VRKAIEAKLPTLAKLFRRRLDDQYWNEHIWDHG